MIHLNQDVREPGSLVRKGLLLLWATAVGCGIVGGPAVGVAQGADPAKGLLGTGGSRGTSRIVQETARMVWPRAILNL